jgi:hypothetical protein
MTTYEALTDLINDERAKLPDNSTGGYVGARRAHLDTLQALLEMTKRYGAPYYTNSPEYDHGYEIGRDSTLEDVQWIVTTALRNIGALS